MQLISLLSGRCHRLSPPPPANQRQAISSDLAVAAHLQVEAIDTRPPLTAGVFQEKKSHIDS